MMPLRAGGMDKPLWGLRVQAPFGAVGIGIGAWAALSGIPEGACACGAEGHMASIGPVGPRCQGLCSLRSGFKGWRWAPFN